MSSHRRVSRGVMRVWMGLSALVLAGFAGWIIVPGAAAPAPEDRAEPAPAAGAPPAVAPPEGAEEPPPLPTRAEVLDTPGLWFGLSAPDVPWSSAQVERLAEAAGAAPNLVQVFVNWTRDYPTEAVEASYRRGALPVLSWEPWAGSAHGTSQPEYALEKIIDGEFDEYLRTIAVAVRQHTWPVGIRLAHEMNGYWYPWSEQLAYNTPGEYVQAWRHVHDLFQEVGATNVIWLWSPNIIRAVSEVSLAALYPGDSYVDWVGMVGYSVSETTAAETFDPTLAALREFTDKPLIVTETGAQPGEHKVAWIGDFFGWLAEHPDVIGFIWFEYDQAEGGNADWRFTATAETTEAFRDGLAGADLADPPLAPAPDPDPDAGG